jgi:hypothetical protein
VSDYVVVAATSRALQQILWEAFANDPLINPIISSREEIVFRNPTQTAMDSANRLSLWLHQVNENEYVKNQPMLHGNNGHEQLRYPPLALNLFYLVTPFAPQGDPESEHLLLGATMQVLYDNSILFLRDQTQGEQVAEEVRIILSRLSLEELTRIWEALREPYRLSVCYEVRVTRIDSKRMPQGALVIDRTAQFGEGSGAVRGIGQ